MTVQQTDTAADRRPAIIVSIWFLLCSAGLAGAWALRNLSFSFDYNHTVFQMPVWTMAAGLCSAGLVFITLLPLIRQSLKLPELRLPLLALILLTGLLMRLFMFTSEPMLEDDYQRYMWDGAITANGLNPYRYSPEQAGWMAAGDPAYRKVITEAGELFTRINHPDLRTIYPPVTQLMFAAAYRIAPFSLTAWRSILLLFDIATIGLLVLLLKHFSRSPLWIALYWLNPLIIKELFNSAHMEALLTPFILGALLLALHKRYTLASTSLIFAAGVKIWPLALYALLLRPLLKQPARLFIALLPAIILGALMAYPILITTFDNHSGFIAYATKWKTNSALFPLLKNTVQTVLELAPFASIDANIITRVLIVLTMLAIILRLGLPSIRSDHDFLAKTALLTAAVFLLSPAQFPWYYVWIAPFIAFYPLVGALLLTATMPLYYSAFYFMSRNQLETFNEFIIWLIWTPIWLLLAIEFLKRSGRLFTYQSIYKNNNL